MNHQRPISVRECPVPSNRNTGPTSAYYHLPSFFCDAPQPICLKSSVSFQQWQGLNGSGFQIALLKSGKQHVSLSSLKLRHRAEPAFYVIKQGGSARQ